MEIGHRRSESTHLFNPVFSATLLYNAAKGHLTESDQPLPFSEAFLVLPIVLTRAIREDLSGWVSTKMRVWLAEHDHHLLDFCKRARAFVPYTRAGIISGCNFGILKISGGALIPALPKLTRARAKGLPRETDEVKELKKRAVYVGRWFSRAGDARAVLSAWGVRP